jgi:hypothetical protein
MRAREFKTFGGSDEINRVQDNIADALKPLADAPLNGHVLVGPVTIGTTPTTVAHKLGQQLQSWCLAGPKANAVVWEISRTKSTLTLQASASVETYLLVF